MTETRTIRTSDGEKTLTLDRRIWSGLDEICEREQVTMGKLIDEVWRQTPERPLADTMESFAVMYFWKAAKKSGTLEDKSLEDPSATDE